MDMSCESCYNFVEDEETGERYCTVASVIDEDESAAFAASSYRKCPFYRFNDEYISVRKQN